jgi:hypothetical protein
MERITPREMEMEGEVITFEDRQELRCAHLDVPSGTLKYFSLTTAQGLVLTSTVILVVCASLNLLRLLDSKMPNKHLNFGE